MFERITNELKSCKKKKKARDMSQTDPKFYYAHDKDEKTAPKIEKTICEGDYLFVVGRHK